MEPIISFSPIAEPEAAAQLPVEIGSLVVVKLTATCEVAGRVIGFDPERGYDFRETRPLRAVPVDWEPWRAWVDPAKVFPAF